MEKKEEVEDMENPFRNSWQPSFWLQKYKEILADISFIYSALGNYDCETEMANPGLRTEILEEKASHRHLMRSS